MTLSTIDRKRADVSIPALKRKAKAGGDTTNDRALIRLGKTNTQVVIGQDDLSGWDDDELRQGCRKDKYGSFSGQPPRVVPKALYDELIKRTFADAREQFRQDLKDAVEVLGTIVRDTSADNKDRIAASKIIIDRVLGKEAVQVNVDVKAKWETALESAIVSVANMETLIEATATEEELDDEDDPFK